MNRAVLLPTHEPYMSDSKDPGPIWPESQARGDRATPEEAAWLRAYVRAHGEQATADRVGIGRDAVVRFCAEVGQYRSNLNLLRAFLAREGFKVSVRRIAFLTLA